MEVWKTEEPRVNFEKRFAHYEIYTWTLCHSYLHEKQTSKIQSLKHLILSNPSHCPSRMWRVLVECSIRLYGVVTGMEPDLSFACVFVVYNITSGRLKYFAIGYLQMMWYHKKSSFKGKPAWVYRQKANQMSGIAKKSFLN